MVLEVTGRRRHPTRARWLGLCSVDLYLEMACSVPRLLQELRLDHRTNVRFLPLAAFCTEQHERCARIRAHLGPCAYGAASPVEIFLLDMTSCDRKLDVHEVVL